MPCDKKEDNFIYAPVYEQNLWTEKKSGRKFTICKSCSKANFIDELEDGYCKTCEEPLGDAHGDLISAKCLEKACWNYMKNLTDKANSATEALDIVQKIIDGESNIDITKVLNHLKKNKYHVGYSHTIFDKSIGYPVENHIKRETISVLNNEYEKLTWMSGMIVDDFIFEKVKNGEVVGYSFGAYGSSIPLMESDE